MARWLALALVLAVAGSGCIEFVGDAGGADAVEDDGSGTPAEHAAVAMASKEERKVHLTLVRGGDRHPYALDDGTVAVALDGVACTQLRAAGDATWEVGEDLVLTPVTAGCGGRLQSGASLVITVTMFGSLVAQQTVAVR